MDKLESANIKLPRKLYVNDGELYEYVGTQGTYVLMRRFAYKAQYGYEPNVHYVPADKMEFWQEISEQ